MVKRDIEWLRSSEISKSFLICKDSDKRHIADPNFEDWIITESRKRIATSFGDGLMMDDDGFSYATPLSLAKPPDDPFPCIQIISARCRCSWNDVTAVFQGRSGTAYIFVQCG